jgi:hypothetical protein
MRRATRTIATLAVMAALAACSDSADPDNGLPQDFTGNYTLVSFAIGGVEIPGTTGTFTMTATTYEASVSVPGQGAVVDEGTYTATGTAASGTWTQQSSIDANLQYQGTYAWNASTSELTLDTTVQGVRNVLVLEKQ